MSTPHECKCGICGRVMSPMFVSGIDYTDPKFTGAAPAPNLTQYKTYAVCTKCNCFHELGGLCTYSVASVVQQPEKP